MKILSFGLSGHLFRCTVPVLIVYAAVRFGISPSAVCLILLVRLAVRLILQFIAGIIRIAFVFVFLWLLTLIF